MTLSAEERWIRFEACHNFRDLGGYETEDGRRVRWRHLFRSGNLAKLTAADIGLLRHRLGVRTVIDLREGREREAEDIAARLGEAGVALLHHSLNRRDGGDADPVPDWADLGAAYLWMARGLGSVVADVLRAICAPDALPLVFHCAAGKDRTGIIAAVLLGLLGVPDRVIVDDYALSELARQRQSPADLAAAFRYVRERGLPEDVIHARPASMAVFLEGTRRDYGGVTAYAAAHGIGADLVDRLRQRLLE